MIIGSNTKRPRYFDRQQLQAEDLSLEQAYQDRREVQLNRHLHGWGIRCGALLQQSGDMSISLSEGFAIAPQGQVLMIPAVDEIDLAELLENACVTPPGDCDINIGPGEIELPENLYLVAKPAVIPSNAQPQFPDECQHPGTNMQYSRECEAICIEIVCEIHTPRSFDCTDLRNYLCPPAGTVRNHTALWNTVLTCPEVVEDTDNFVVLGRLIFDIDDREVTLEGIDYSVRRPLFSVQLIQDYLSCLCTTAIPTQEPTPTPTITPTFVPTFFPTQDFPTFIPTFFPTQDLPTFIPTFFPTQDLPTLVPTFNPTFDVPTFNPTFGTTFEPTFFPTFEVPTFLPTFGPSGIIDDILVGGIDTNVFDVDRGLNTSIDEFVLLSDSNKETLRGMGINNVVELHAANTEALTEVLGISETRAAEFKVNALESVRRGQEISLDENVFDVELGKTMSAENVHNIGRVRGNILRAQGYASVADIANANSEIVSNILGISEQQAGEFIQDARTRMLKS